MACRIVMVSNGIGKEPSRELEGKRCSSHAAVARLLKEGQNATVRELNGGFSGYFRLIWNEGKNYCVSHPQTDY